MDWLVSSSLFVVSATLGYLYFKETQRSESLQNEIKTLKKELQTLQQQKSTASPETNKPIVDDHSSTAATVDRSKLKDSDSDVWREQAASKQRELSIALAEKQQLLDRLSQLQSSSSSSVTPVSSAKQIEEPIVKSSPPPQRTTSEPASVLSKRTRASQTNKSEQTVAVEVSDESGVTSNESGTFRKKEPLSRSTTNNPTTTANDSTNIDSESSTGTFRKKDIVSSSTPPFMAAAATTNSANVATTDTDDQYSSVRIKHVAGASNKIADFAAAASTSTAESTNAPAVALPKYREPEVWEQNLIALEQNKWGPQMKSANFKKYGPRHRPKIPSIFVHPADAVLTDSPGFHRELLSQPDAERAKITKFVASSDLDPTQGTWTAPQDVVVQVKRRPIADGSLRVVYDCKVLNQPNESFVLKQAKLPEHANREVFERDIRMQAICQRWAEKFNDADPPKRVEYVDAWLVEFPDRLNKEPMMMERKLRGTFTKYNDNQGQICDKRNTPQAFSHFTYEMSEQRLVIVDIQGDGDHYTDPQIHSNERTFQFGLGDLSKTGINRFLATHHCNAVCRALQLKDLHPTDVASQQGSAGTRSRSNSTTTRPTGLTLPFPQEFSDRMATFGNEWSALTPTPNADRWRKLHAGKSLRLRQRVMSVLCWGSRLFVASHDGSLSVYSSALDSNEPIETFKKHTGPINSMCIDNMPTYLFTGSTDSNVNVWQVLPQSVKHVKQIEDHTDDISALACNDQILLTGSKDKLVRVFSFSTWTCKSTLIGHEKSVLSLAVTSDSMYAFSGSMDGVIKVWDLNSTQCIFNLESHTNWCRALWLSGRHLISGGFDQRLIVWDLQALEPIKIIDEKSKVRSLISNDQTIVCGCDELKVYAIPSFDTLLHLDQKLSVESVCFDGKQQRVYAATSETITLFE